MFVYHVWRRASGEEACLVCLDPARLLNYQGSSRGVVGTDNVGMHEHNFICTYIYHYHHLDVYSYNCSTLYSGHPCTVVY